MKFNTFSKPCKEVRTQGFVIEFYYLLMILHWKQKLFDNTGAVYTPHYFYVFYFCVIKTFYALEAHLNSVYVKQKSVNFLFKFIQIGNSKTCYEILLLKNCSEECTLQ